MKSLVLKCLMALAVLGIGVLPLQMVCAAQTGVAQKEALSVLQKQADQLEHYAKSSLIEQQERHDVLYLLPVSKPQKVNGRWRHEKQKELQVTILQQTFELDPNVGLGALRRYYQNAFKSIQEALLFSCTGLACGSSNQWANGVFAKKVLYGPDRQQFYQVGSLGHFNLTAASATSHAKNQNLNVYLQAYLVQRGNRRVYLHLVWLAEFDQASRSDSELDSKSVISNNAAVSLAVNAQTISAQAFARISLAEMKNAELFTALLKRLETHQQAARGIWVLAGYEPFKVPSKNANYEELAKAQQAVNEQSLQHAVELRRLLIKAGFKAETVFSYGVGDWIFSGFDEPGVDVFWRALP